MTYKPSPESQAKTAAAVVLWISQMRQIAAEAESRMERGEPANDVWNFMSVIDNWMIARNRHDLDIFPEPIDDDPDDDNEYWLGAGAFDEKLKWGRRP